MTYIKLTFPNKTAKEIIDACDNKLGNGKFLFNTDWYKDEDFYTKEKCRKGTRYVTTTMDSYGKSWDECNSLVTEKKTMLNFAELIFFVQEYYKQTGNYPDWKYWSWTSSQTSDGLFVYVGSSDDGGGRVYGYRPGLSDSVLGCAFSAEKIEDLNIEPSTLDSPSRAGALPETLEINGITYKRV